MSTVLLAIFILAILILINALFVAAEFATHLFQLPCHQELRSKEITWMIHEIRSVLTANGS